MIVVLASRYDVTAQQLVERWAAHGACLLTCEDLSLAGWGYYLPDSSTATAVIGGRKVVLGEIRGVVTRLPWVTEWELVSIISADRAYVAAEMSAFLAFWLSDLDCPVLNRPTPGSLNGPPWRREQWISTAARVGLRVPSVRHHLTLSSAATVHEQVGASTTVTVVGNRCLGHADRTLLERSRLLAEAANVELLGIQFSDACPEATFLSASVYPEINSVEVTDAMLRYFA